MEASAGGTSWEDHVADPSESSIEVQRLGPVQAFYEPCGVHLHAGVHVRLGQVAPVDALGADATVEGPLRRGVPPGGPPEHLPRLVQHGVLLHSHVSGVQARAAPRQLVARRPDIHA